MESLDSQKQAVKAFRVEENVRQTVTKAHLNAVCTRFASE